MCLLPFYNENMSIESKIELRIKQRMRYWARDRCVVQKDDQWTYPKVSSEWKQSEGVCRAKKWEQKTLGRKHAKLVEWKA